MMVAEDGDTEEYVNDMIEEVFSRLNSAVLLTSAQLCKAKAGTDVKTIRLKELWLNSILKVYRRKG